MASIYSSFISRYFVVFAITLAVYVQSYGQDVQELMDTYNLAVKNNNVSEAATLSKKIAFGLWRNEDLQGSINYFKKASEHYEKLNEKESLQKVFASIGLVNAELQEHSEAIKYYNRALKLSKESADKKFLVNTYFNLAISNNAIDKTKRAIGDLEEALPIVLELNDIDLKQTCYKYLADFNDKIGNKAKAKEYMDNYYLLIRSIQNEQLVEKRAKQMQEIEGQLTKAEVESDAAKTALLSKAEQLHKTEKTLREVEKIAIEKQFQVNLLNTEKELKEMTIKAQEANLRSSRTMRNSFIVGFLLVSILVVVILLDAKKKKAANAKINEQHLNITSSINYAQRIQQAMLPKNEEAGGFIENNAFILFKPRDVVSGDFYWFKRLPQSGDLIIAAVDCTGHGVPGAFMSMIGMNALNSIVNNGIREANVILDELHKNIRTALSQSETGNNDGMDMSLCIIREKKIEFSGAKNPMVYVQNNEIFKVKADTHPIGGGKYSKEKPFTKHVIDITSDTTVYLFSDGFQDQFGGSNNMKFMAKKFRNLLLDIHQLPLTKQQEKLESTFEEWKGERHQTDDILVIGFKVEA